MGLAVTVGMLSDLLEHDLEGAEWLQEAIRSANSLLATHKLPAHVEPNTPIQDASRCSLDSYPYSFLHYLRRIYAHVARDPGVPSETLHKHARQREPTRAAART